LANTARPCPHDAKPEWRFVKAGAGGAIGRLLEKGTKRIFEMLVLTRRPGEEIVIGDGIRLSVLAIKGSQVRLGVLAPPEVPILRVELALRRQFEERKPTSGGGPESYAPEG
jgi:carbon storage regulator